MSDIDFDELDKAVNSLMNQRTEPGSVDLPAQSAPAQSPLIATPPQSAAIDTGAIASETPQATPIVRRPTGKYMDMVSPAARSRSAPIKQDVVKSVNRDNGLIQPVSAPIVPNESQTPPGISTEDEDLDRAEYKPVASEPMQSPFLSDVAVDKRPLGSQDSTSQDNWNVLDYVEQTSQSAAVEEQATPEVKFTDSPDTFAPEPIVVPPELSADVLALESDINASNGSIDAAEHVKRVENNSTIISSPGDIVPQYSPEVANSPEPSAVFDAASDVPKQLDHPERKKSGWMIFVWILILVVVGAGGGVAAWYFLAK